MTIDVSTPDGSSFTFPDGTPQETIQSALDSHFGVKPSAPAAADIGENRAGVVSMLRGIPLAGPFADKAVAALNAAGQPLIGSPKLSQAETFSERMAENEKLIKDGTDAFEKSSPIGSTVGKVLAGGAALAPVMAAAPAVFGIGAASVPASMAAGAGSGAAINAADASLRGEDPGKAAMWGAGGGAVGNLAGRAIGAAAENLANRSAVKTAATNELAQAASRQMVNLPSAAASDNLVTQRVAAATKELPFIGEPLVRAAKRADEELGAALSRTEVGYGSGSTFNAGDVAKTGLIDWIKGGSQAVQKRVYGRVDSMVDPAITRELDATRAMIGTIAADRQAAALEGPGKAVDLVLGAVQRPGGLTYDGLKGLRSSIGEMLDSGILPEGIRGTELKRIYGALSIDLKDTVEAAGGHAARKAFDQANTINRLISQRRESLAKISGADASAAPEQVVDRLIAMAGGSARADQQRLLLARKAIGSKDWDEVASAAVSRIGRDAEGNFSAARFLTAYGKISDQGKRLLFDSTGRSDLAQALNDIAKLSSRAKQLTLYGNPSGTGRVLGGLEIVRSALTAPVAVVGSVLGGRIVANRLAAPIGVKPGTIRTAQQNAEVRALLEHVLDTASLAAGVSTTPRQRIPPQISAPLQLAIQ